MLWSRQSAREEKKIALDKRKKKSEDRYKGKVWRRKKRKKMCG